MDIQVIPKEEAGQTPSNLKSIGAARVPKYPFADMEEGDKLEIVYSNTKDRAAILANLTYFIRKNPALAFGYRLIVDDEVDPPKRILEIYRTK